MTERSRCRSIGELTEEGIPSIGNEKILLFQEFLNSKIPCNLKWISFPSQLPFFFYSTGWRLLNLHSST